MARLPTPGSDAGQWGQILNDFLNQVHTPNGELKNDSVDTVQIKDGAVTKAKLENQVQASLDDALPSSQKGVANGVATLDSTSKLTASQIPTGFLTKSTDSNDIGKAIDAYTGAPLTVETSVNLGTAGHAAAYTATTNTLATKADLVNGIVPVSQLPAANSVETILLANDQAALRALSCQAGDIVQTRGYWSAGDGGEGSYRVVTSSATENGGTTLVLANGLRAVRMRQAGRINVRMFGAIGDGGTHPLSEKYGNLAAAQAVYSHATALTDTVDWCAIQAAVNFVASGDPVCPAIDIPQGAFWVSQSIELPQGPQIIMRGQGWQESSGHVTTVFKRTNPLPILHAAPGSYVTPAQNNTTDQTRIRINLTDIGFDGGNLNAELIDLGGLNPSIITRCSFKYTLKEGLILRQAYNIQLHACYFRACGSADGTSFPVVRITGPQGVTEQSSNSILFEGCELENNRSTEFKIEGSANESLNVRFVGCKVEGETNAPVVDIAWGAVIQWISGMWVRGTACTAPLWRQLGTAPLTRRQNSIIGLQMICRGNPPCLVDVNVGALEMIAVGLDANPTVAYVRVSAPMAITDFDHKGLTRTSDSIPLLKDLRTGVVDFTTNDSPLRIGDTYLYQPVSGGTPVPQRIETTGEFSVVRSAAVNLAFSATTSGDPNASLKIRASGDIEFGGGTDPTDSIVTWYTNKVIGTAALWKTGGLVVPNLGDISSKSSAQIDTDFTALAGNNTIPNETVALAQDGASLVVIAKHGNQWYKSPTYTPIA